MVIRQTYTLQKRIFVNHQIRANEVRLIDENDTQVGVVRLQEALNMAQERGLDLIQVTEKVDPPVCKIGDYGKYLYREEKKAKEAKKHTGGDLKEVRLTYTMSEHDLQTRADQALKFLGRGDRIRVTLPLRGRQKALEGFAREKMQKFLTMISASVPLKMERDIRREPRGLSTIATKQ